MVALCVALGSGAFAAVQAGPSQTGVIRACYEKKGGELRLLRGRAKCSKQERRLSFSKRGPRGAQGVKGDPGAQGPVGPTNAYSTRPNTAVPLELTATTVTTLALPPGTYVIWAKLWVDGPSGISGADCTLTAGPDTDNARVQAQVATANVQIPMALALDHASAATESVTLSCARVGSATVTAVRPVITAIRVGSIG